MKMPSSAASACGRNREESMAVPSSMSGARLNGTQSAIIELIMVRIPEGWFGMGCESGRDDEKPVHRVGVAALELGAYPVRSARWEEDRVGKGGRSRWPSFHEKKE